MKRFELQEAPASQIGPVKARFEPVVAPSCPPSPVKKNDIPRKQIDQESPRARTLWRFIDRISTEKLVRCWKPSPRINLRIVVLPETIWANLYRVCQQCCSFPDSRLG